MHEYIILYFFVLAIFFYLYLVFFQKKNKEGLTGNIPPNGIGQNGAAYSSSIQNNYQALKDKLLIGQYQAEYDSSMVGLSDYIHMLMLQTALQVDLTSPTITDANIKLFQQINALNGMQDSLNTIIKFTDSHVK